MHVSRTTSERPSSRFGLNKPSGEADSPIHQRGEPTSSPRGFRMSVSQLPLEGSVLGKRRASLMEEPKFPSHVTAMMDISSAFRRESMISPVDVVPPHTRFASTSSSPPCPLSSLSVSHPSHTHSATESPTNRKIRPRPLSVSVQKAKEDTHGAVVELENQQYSEADEHRPSLPGFKSLFGMNDAEERPIFSRNNSSSGFPDLQTLKGPLSLALGPYGGTTRNSNDSGTTSLWSSSRSSFGARESISTSLTASSSVTAALTPSSATSFMIMPPLKPQSPGSAGFVPPAQQRYHQNGGPSAHRISTPEIGMEQDPAGSGNTGHSSGLLLRDLAKRPSYANFGAEIEKQRVEVERQRSMAEAEEAWRRQSDNAAVLSDERKRLLGSSPRPLPPRELQGGPVAPVDPSYSDEALRAARTRLLRYESYPFGSKDARIEIQTSAISTNACDPHRRQSMFPQHVSDATGHPGIINLGDSAEPAKRFSETASPGWQEPFEQHHRLSTSSQRDMQFEEIIRKASVDLAKRSATSSLTGTPIMAARTLMLPNISSEPTARAASPRTTLLHNRVFDAAETANLKEREKREQNSGQMPTAPTSAAASRSATPRRVPSPLPSRSVTLPSPSSLGRSLDQRLRSQSQQGLQGTQLHSVDAGEYRRSSFQIQPDTSRPHSQRHSVSIDIDQRQMNRSRRSPRQNPAEQSSTFYAGASMRNGRAYDLPRSMDRALGASHNDGLRSGEGSRKESSVHLSAGNVDTVVPYYDNPEQPPAPGANNKLEFPSVLRKDYQSESNSSGPSLGAPSSISAQGPAPYMVRHPTDYLPQQQHGNSAAAHNLYGSWHPESRMNTYTSLPPGPVRTITAPSMVNSGPTLPGPRYTCEYCGKSFSRPSSLKIHIYSHTGEKPYKCTWPNCTRSFSVQSNLKRHAKVHLENSGHQATSSGNNNLNTESEPANVATALLAGAQGRSIAGGLSSSSYSADFLTPQTTQPLPTNSNTDGYFDLRHIHATKPGSHSPAPTGRFKAHLGSSRPTTPAEMQGYLASPSNPKLPASFGNTGPPRGPSHLQYSSRDISSSGRRVSGSSVYEDHDQMEEDELAE
ncbi:hypothetical protein QFC19_003563 [Naganishia cerealis]|uniref:Uncharacterized protein n=1 Tax=Naganishia cerealis TaxID=610337 RepID=A0ACC2W3Z3_9TREE|nr:hypothetical protein QFC19_003563 [Naganishia cerealis]